MELKEDHPHMITFLTFDYGKFGSDSFKQWDYFGAEDLLLGFHRTIYESNMSFDEWEGSFGEVAHTDQSAMLQLQIVSNAKCVILAGDNSNLLMSDGVQFVYGETCWQQVSLHTTDQQQILGHTKSMQNITTALAGITCIVDLTPRLV